VQVCITKGLSYGRAAPVTCMQYLSIVVSEVVGMALFHEFTSGLGVLGTCLITASMACCVTWEVRRKAQQGGPSASGVQGDERLVMHDTDCAVLRDASMTKR
jgi:hypothetical protein